MLKRTFIAAVIASLVHLPAHAAVQVNTGNTSQRVAAPTRAAAHGASGIVNRVTPEQMRERGNAPVALGAAMKAFALVTDGFDYAGTGDVEYWMKSAKDLGHSGQALGGALTHLVRGVNGSTATAVRALGAQLTGLDWGGTGDVNYWMLRTKEIGQSVRRVGKDLRTLSAGAGAATVSYNRLLNGFSRVAESVDYAGTGDVEYWMKTTKDFALIGRATGKGLATMTNDSDEPVNALVRDIAHQLKNLDEGGTGDVYYWMGRARTMADRITSLGRSLAALSQGN